MGVVVIVGCSRGVPARLCKAPGHLCHPPPQNALGRWQAGSVTCGRWPAAAGLLLQTLPSALVFPAHPGCSLDPNGPGAKPGVPVKAYLLSDVKAKARSKYGNW